MGQCFSANIMHTQCILYVTFTTYCVKTHWTTVAKQNWNYSFQNGYGIRDMLSNKKFKIGKVFLHVGCYGWFSFNLISVRCFAMKSMCLLAIPTVRENNFIFNSVANDAHNSCVVVIVTIISSLYRNDIQFRVARISYFTHLTLLTYSWVCFELYLWSRRYSEYLCKRSDSSNSSKIIKLFMSFTHIIGRLWHSMLWVMNQ